jgi:uncharacterized membrane protein
MTENSNVPVVDKGDGGTAVIIYALYLASFVIGVTSIVGVIMAYMARDKAPAWLQSHYRFQIRTFWLFMLFAVISVLLTFVFIGILTGALTAIWFIIRCVKGILWAQKGQEVPDPASWWLGEAKK